MTKPEKRRLGDILVETAIISEADLDKALVLGKAKGLRLGEALIELGILSEDRILWALAQQLDLSFIKITDDQVIPEAVRLIPEEMARRHASLPLIRLGDELTLAVNDPLQDDFFEDISRLTGCQIHLSLARANDITAALDHVHGKALPARAHVEAALRSEFYNDDDLREFALDKTGARLLERLVGDCLAKTVNTIHVDVLERGAEVRFRKAGILRPVLFMDTDQGRALLMRLAMMGGVQGDEKARSWRVQLKAGEGVAVDVHRLRVRGGEAATLRILGQRARQTPFAKLGLTTAQRALVDAILQNPGLVIITGAADSGRATTVMSILDRFDSNSRRIITAEDWIRTEHPGYIQITPEFLPPDSSRLPALVSLDPDALYVESLTSKEEIEDALRAGMAGAFVFTLMGFRRAGSALSYTAGLNIQPTLVADGLTGVIAQRLVRVLCSECKTKVKLKPSQLAGLTPEIQKDLLDSEVYAPQGCPACEGSGYAGRAAVFEVLAMDEKIHDAVASGISVVGLPVDFGKPGHELSDRVLEKIKKGVCAWTEIMAFR